MDKYVSELITKHLDNLFYKMCDQFYLEMENRDKAVKLFDVTEADINEVIQERIKEIESNAYEQGYEEGEKEGYDSGYEDGKNDAE